MFLFTLLYTPYSTLINLFQSPGPSEDRLLHLKCPSGPAPRDVSALLQSPSSSSSSLRDALHALHAQLPPDEFLVPYQHWLRLFTHLEMVHLDSDTARDEPSLQGKTPWLLRLYHGQWRRGVTAGGCRNYSETFHLNPQLLLVVPEARSDVVLSVTQQNSLEPQVIGFTG